MAARIQAVVFPQSCRSADEFGQYFAQVLLRDIQIRNLFASSADNVSLQDGLSSTLSIPNDAVTESHIKPKLKTAPTE
ncbi:hypothetical protein HYN46_12880 [Aquirhabdus parva]|uniref:Uncharacterized protein n=1 Tax=Aquirhabdus parva TaxID=2283318 RepID=A0A345P8N5_9GAMM|nr:hypothetical protein HYN46_12880 [Aquirhabdus parva]